MTAASIMKKWTPQQLAKVRKDLNIPGEDVEIIQALNTAMDNNLVWSDVFKFAKREIMRLRNLNAKIVHDDVEIKRCNHELGEEIDFLYDILGECWIFDEHKAYCSHLKTPLLAGCDCGLKELHDKYDNLLKEKLKKELANGS